MGEKQQAAPARAVAQAGEARAEADTSLTDAAPRASMPPERQPDVDSNASPVEQQAVEIELRPHNLIQPLLGVRAIEVDDEVILADLLSDQYVRLNPTATFIWRLILQTIPLREISRQVAAQYTLDSDRAYDVTAGFIKELIRRGFAVASTEAES